MLTIKEQVEQRGRELAKASAKEELKAKNRAKKMKKLPTQKRKEIFLQALQNQNGIIYRACLEACICRDTFTLWRNKDAEFQSNAYRVIDNCTDLMKEEMIKLARNSAGGGHFPAIKYILETRYFRERERDYNVLNNIPEEARINIYLPKKDDELHEEK